MAKKPTYEELEQRVKELGNKAFERKRAEEALQESEERFRLAFENANDGVCLVDTDGNLVRVNNRMCDIFGYSKKELESMTINDIAHPEDSGISPKFIEKSISGEVESAVFEKRYFHNQGHIIWGQVSSSIIKDEKGDPLYFISHVQDITQRKQAQKALRESEEKARQYLDIAGVAFVALDNEGSITSINKRGLEILGYQREELLGKNWFKTCLPERFQKDILDVYHQLIRGEVEPVEYYENPVLTKDGKERIIAWHNSVLRNPGGEIVGSLSSGEDITERLLAEEALQESEKRLKGIFKSIPSPIVLYDTEGHPLYLNPAFTALFLWSLDELKGQRIPFVPDDQKELSARKIGEVYRTGKVVNYETKRLTKQGDVLDVIVSGAFVTGPDGDPVEMVATLTDITDLKQAEEALRASEEKYRTVLESNPDPVVVYDMEGRVIYLNPAFTRVFGWSLEEQIGKQIDDFVPEENWSETRMMISKVTVLGESFSGLETRRYTKKGNILDISISGSCYRDHKGNVAASVINLRDITEQKRLEDQLQRAQKMEAIGTLAGGVAHDLNNILGGLVSYPELLLLQLPEDSPLRKSILTIQKSGEKAAAVVQDLLTLARRGVIATEVVNLNDVISEYLESPEHENLQSYHPGVHIETHLAADTLNIMGSSTHLSKTVMNLISNAAEAMPLGGKIIITTENRYIDRPIRGYDNVKEGDYVVFTVSDTGTGISPDDIEKIFEPFYTKKKMGRSGTGLGMAVVWGTVKDHNGYIHVQSTEGKARPPRLSPRDGGQGTTFTLYFPVTRKSLKERSEISLKDYIGKGEAILIVDDVEEQRKIASGMLKELGYSVVSVSSGEEAVEYLKTHKVALLVLDMIMDPGMDGLETYKKIIELNPGQKAIIASGFSETGRVKEVQSLGAGAYIRKPFLLEKIGLAVKEELGK